MVAVLRVNADLVLAVDAAERHNDVLACHAGRQLADEIDCEARVKARTNVER